MSKISELAFDSNYPLVSDLRSKARCRVPKFAFEYLDNGCYENHNLNKNTTDIEKLELMPRYLADAKQFSLKTELFGETYDAPFGISPIGLQGMVWPQATQILAKAAVKANIPFILSTVATASLEEIATITEGKAWFQLYYPANDEIRADILKRLQESGYKVLVLLCDTPTFGYRASEIKNGLSMPPKLNLRNILSVLTKPQWAIETLKAGIPKFATLKPYMNDNSKYGINVKQMGQFMNATFDGRLNEQRIADIRKIWRGKLILKGITNAGDMQRAISWGLDGIIVSNHGGRQLEAGQSSIKALSHLVKHYKGKIPIMMDGGIRDASHIARVMASGADFSFMGRAFMYGVSALGQAGGDHTINILKRQLQQVVEQIGCEQIKDLPKHLIKDP